MLLFSLERCFYKKSSWAASIHSLGGLLSPLFWEKGLKEPMSNCLSSDPVKTTPFVQLGPKDQSMTQLCWYRHSQNSSFKILPLSGLEMKRIESWSTHTLKYLHRSSEKKNKGMKYTKGFSSISMVFLLLFFFGSSFTNPRSLLAILWMHPPVDVTLSHWAEIPCVN